MIKGGYKIIDLRDNNFTLGTAATIAGIYEAIEGNYRKALLLSGITVANVEYPDRYVNFYVSSDNYVAETNIGATEVTVTVTDEDSVTIAAVQTAKSK